MLYVEQLQLLAPVVDDAKFVQFVHNVLPAYEYVLAGQVDSHAEETPVLLEYVPARHNLQLLEPDMEEYFPGGQYRHVLFDVAPIVVEYVPGVHCMHSESPVKSI